METLTKHLTWQFEEFIDLAKNTNQWSTIKNHRNMFNERCKSENNLRRSDEQPCLSSVCSSHETINMTIKTLPQENKQFGQFAVLPWTWKKATKSTEHSHDHMFNVRLEKHNLNRTFNKTNRISIHRLGH